MPESRRPLVSANWKMNLNHFEAIQTVQKLFWSLTPEDFRAAEVTIHPPFTDLRSVQTVLEADSIPIALGAQNCHHEDKGAYTGEVSPAMLMKLNVAYVIVGHSERRQHFGETDDVVAAKVKSVTRNGMTPIMCVGETQQTRDEGRADEHVSQQVLAGLAKLKKDEIAKVVIAYEPIWAIGTGNAATAEDAQYMCKGIRTLLQQKYGIETAAAIRIQYGGSVKASNARELLSLDDVDGFLVGGASLDPEEFARIVASAHN